jgi:hypothetical protein
MATAIDEFLPGEELRFAVVEQILLPHLAALHEEGVPPLSGELSVWVREAAGYAAPFSSGAYSVAAVDFEVRCRFRRTFRRSRCLFFLQARLSRPLPNTGFSGFKLSGEISEESGAYLAKLKSKVGHYHQQEWLRW